MECCNALRPLCHVSSSYSLLFPCHLLACHAFHIMSSCASHLHTCSSHAPISSRVPFYLFSCAGVKCSRIQPRLAKQPWYTTGRPPVKFRAIWRSFGTPTVNRVTAKASFSLQPNTSPKWPKTHPKPPPFSPPFDHDRVCKNRSPFGLS